MRRPSVILSSLALPVAMLTAAENFPGGLPWRHFEQPKFPAALLGTTVCDGFAVIVFTFDADGRIMDRVAVEASHPAYSIEVYRALENSQIDTSRHQPVVRREIVRFDFLRTAAIVVKTHRDAAKSAFTPYGDGLADALVTMNERELYPPLRLVTGAKPSYPVGRSSDVPEVRVTVDFVVDAEGRVRVPAILSQVEPEWADSVLEAVHGWTFAPPRQGDLAVQVMARRVFRFGRRSGS